MVSTVYSSVTHLPGVFLPSDFLWEYQIELVAMELPCFGFTFPTSLWYSAARFQAWWLVALPVYAPYVGTFFDKSILNKLVCKFDRIENSSFVLCKYTLIAIIDIVIT